MTATDLETLFARPADAGLEDAALAYLQARLARDEAEAQTARTRSWLAQAEQQLLRKLDEAKLRSLTTGEQTLTASASVYYAVPADSLDDSAFHRWLLVHGGRDLVRRRVDADGFRAFCRALVEKGKNLHPLVKVATKRTIKSKPAGVKDAT